MAFRFDRGFQLLLVAFSSTQLAVGHPLFNGHVISRSEDLLPAYDYVVVGAGASGLTVANRLSEEPNISVLIIEAGDFDKKEDYVTIPGLAGGAVGTKYDWNTTYIASASIGGRGISIPQGRVVGGSTKLNRMVFDRGSKSDYDGWEALGNKGWNFDGLLPYFKKNEKFSPATKGIKEEYGIKDDVRFRGDKGYMQTTYSPFFWPTTKNFIQATKDLKIPINDQATGNAFGGYFCTHNMDQNYSRSSAEEAYYASAAARPNFHILTGNQVTRILTGSSPDGTVKVTGMEFASAKDASRQSVQVTKEAILAAGALHSPQLLQISGIGDPKLLKSLNVTTVIDLPAVGHNLHDHLNSVVVNILNTTVLTNTLGTNATFAAAARQEYDTQRSGPLTSPSGDFLLFLPLSTYSPASEAIFAQAAAGDPSASLPPDTPPSVAKGYAAQYASLNKKLLAKDSAVLEIIWADGAVVLGLQHPYSRGRLSAASSSIFDAPVADVGFLRNPLDVALLREGVRWARRFAQTPGIGALRPFEVVPGPNVTADADIDAHVRGSVSTLYHPAGTCKMGLRAEGGVVDADLKVYGVDGLRVVDASVMPMLPASHTMTTVYAVAEKAAEIIKRSGGYREMARV
ncbi:putative oxidoreductase [Clohesyomyces aquaticus]|uniref:Putative oxidoreductase n=1 Tax=Clohesyomyces aquaticus TaxID=1231657 RepID=A0A1Y1ZGR8_9PLEO|nr:putative oxidoreductase [Clohesyomyces aquaticus]